MLGKYRLLARLGQGGMAEVYLAVVAGPGGFNKLQVVKVMKPELLEEPEHRTMFLEEGRLAARLNHPNIVQTNEVQIDGDHHFIAMEYLDGQPLHRIVRRANKTPEKVPLTWHLHFLCEVLAALEYAHAAADFDGSPLAVVHRDVTPHNVFITYTGQVKLCDFGIAKTMSSSIETRHGVLKGKVSYMAPEQVLATRVDRRADLFAVGIMLWEAATASRMWKDLSDVQIMQALSQGRIPSAREVNPGLDRDLELVIERALAPRPEDRYASAAEFRRELEAFLFSRTARIKPDQMGAWVASLFERERENLQKVIQEQLAGSDKASPPVALDPPRPSGGDSSPSRSGIHAGTAEPNPGRSLTNASVELSTPRRARGTWAAVLGALAASVVFLLAAVVVLVLRGRTTEPTVEALPHVAEAPVAAPTEAPAKTIRLRIQATPLDAKLTLAGRELEDNPWVGEVPVSDAEQELVITLDGHQTERRLLRLDANQRIEITLKPSAAPAGATRPRVVADKPKPDAVPEPAAPKKKPPSTPLDTEDPW